MAKQTSIFTIVGARPQFIKAAVLSREIASRAGFVEVMCHTGQHYDSEMSDVFFEELGIPHPTHNLGVGSASHGAQTGQMLQKIESVLLSARPDWVLVYGDTNSTLAGALAASKLNIPLAHVEAGLRSFNRSMPEEINRVITDHVSDLLFAPTQVGAKNLENEGIPQEKVETVGDIMLDAVRIYGQNLGDKVLSTLEISANQYSLATIHRPQNTDTPQSLTKIMDALVASQSAGPVVLPLHPRTRAKLEAFGTLDKYRQALRIIEPVSYLDMMALVRSASLVITDSGGLQKEAFFHRVPCVTLRPDTEWTELLELGWIELCAPESSEQIVAAIEKMRHQKGREAQPYGDQFASRRILDAIERYG